jgi:hypothetical protein
MAFLDFARSRIALHLLRLSLLLGAFSVTGAAWAQESSSKEYQVKAAFLYNFVQFVKWPPGAFTSPDAPLEIGVLGDDPFGGALEDIVHNASVNGHKLVVMHSHSLDDLRGCQLIFVARSEENQMGQILSTTGPRPILTVSEIDRFAENGGDIDFYISDGKVRFEINPGAARHAGLKISSQLLALGRIVGGEN